MTHTGASFYGSPVPRPIDREQRHACPSCGPLSSTSCTTCGGAGVVDELTLQRVTSRAVAEFSRQTEPAPPDPHAPRWADADEAGL